MVSVLRKEASALLAGVLHWTHLYGLLCSMQAEQEDKKLKAARNASAPPRISAKTAKKDAVRLEQMKPSAGISRKVLNIELLATCCPSYLREERLLLYASLLNLPYKQSIEMQLKVRSRPTFLQAYE